MKQRQQLQNIIDYIGLHLDEDLTLERLTAISGMSKFHFHRLFTAYMGLSLYQYIRWLRLKRAAFGLIMDKERSILDIALDAGFDSHEAFSRAFKQICGLSPSQFRKSNNWSSWENPPYRLPELGDHKMIVEIRERPQTRLAVLEHRGDPAGIANSVDKLIAWAKAQRVNLKPQAGDAFGIAYDDPNTTEPSEFRFDLGLRVPGNIQLTGDVIEKSLPAGRYAVTVHKGSRENLDKAVYALYRDWLPSTDETLGDLPCIFSYLNFENDVAETELLTEVMLLLE
ncbi:MAG: AraC family transcriptional regulator [Legionellales bacterium]|nr:AraC family transcriptional regulator [Legionellales bacterium]|tara:strand:- start:81564 stop:82412 length:849 start_codon:yes stop_codon:yes gene_type:complete